MEKDKKLTLALFSFSLNIQGCGVALKKPTDHGRKLAHEILGYVIFAVVAVQALAGAFRPAKAKPGGGEKESAKRSRWLAGHRVTGISMAVLAFANLILGLVLADRSAWFIAGASVVWCALVVGFSAKKVLDLRKKAKWGASLAEANSSNLAWKASSMVDGSRGDGCGAAAAAVTTAAGTMEMGKR